MTGSVIQATRRVDLRMALGQLEAAYVLVATAPSLESILNPPSIGMCTCVDTLIGIVVIRTLMSDQNSNSAKFLPSLVSNRSCY